MTSTDPQRDRLGREEWARFWARGTVTTFEGHFSGNYDQEIAEFWHQALEPLEDGACVVDLATGNGAVALLMAAWARTQNRSLAITGVDYAEVDPEQVRAARPELAADLDAITLIGGTPLEATTLDAGSVDLVSSQYGYEYGDTAAGSREIARILRPGGSLAMILHHSDSAILQQAQEGLAQLDFCINKTDFVRLGQRMAKLFRGLKPGGTGPGKLHWSPGAIKIRESLLDTAERVQKRGETPTARATDAGFIEFLLPSVMQIVERSRQTDDASLARVWANLLAEVETYRLRMADLTSAAVDADGLEKIVDELKAVAIGDARVRPLYYRGTTLLGWALTAVRA